MITDALSAIAAVAQIIAASLFLHSLWLREEMLKDLKEQGVSPPLLKIPVFETIRLRKTYLDTFPMSGRPTTFHRSFMAAAVAATLAATFHLVAIFTKYF